MLPALSSTMTMTTAAAMSLTSTYELGEVMVNVIEKMRSSKLQMKVYDTVMAEMQQKQQPTDEGAGRRGDGAEGQGDRGGRETRMEEVRIGNAIIQGNVGGSWSCSSGQRTSRRAIETEVSRVRKLAG